MKKNSTKRALVSSALSLVLCMTMLIGTTFAWFTDSVTSSGNKIVSGNLDVDLYMWTSATESTEITNNSAPIFGAEDSIVAQNNAANTLWEPGKTQVVYLSIKNNGSLDLKYKVALDVKNPADGKNLYEVMEYAIKNDAKYGDVTSWTDGLSVKPGINTTQANDVALKAGQEHFFALSVHMNEEAGNEYMNGKVEFDISVLAGQLASELDSFDNKYDQFASYPGSGSAPAPTGNTTGVEVEIRDKNEAKVGSVTVPKDAVATGATEVKVNIEKTEYAGNFTVPAGSETQAFEVTVEGIKENNTTPIKVKLRIAPGLDPATVQVYHYDTLVTGTSYDPNTGYVTFETTSFSPFTVLFDAESEYVPPVVDDNELPKQEDIVSEYDLNLTPGYPGYEETWGSFGGFAPTEGLDSKLEAAYVFECPDEGDEKIMNWYCDFYVKLDRDLAENQIFLGGNYGDFGWVGFHNGELTLAANQEMPLLGSVIENPWTYADVKSFVGTFICGVGDVNDALSGATFTVMLRLTNPETLESYNVATVNYTFK